MVSLSFIICHLSFSVAQITIGGNVYGGGNLGPMTGNTSVTVRSGDLNNVYGGARMANVGGNAFVNIDGEHASNYIIVNKVYGGNDIAGKVGKNEAGTKAIQADILQLEGENGIDNTWDACVRISTKVTNTGEEANDAQKIYIGQLFGGGNGDYDYDTEQYAHTDPVTSTTTYEDNPYYGKDVPELAKAYLEICGGSIVYAYGGGNCATVTDKTVICVDNPSKVVNSITDESHKTVENPTGELLTNDRFKNAMGINLGFSYPSSDAFQIGRLFGGNNVAPMAIIPKWNLKSGSIRNLYSGGNEGPMTSPTGILLEIAETSTIKVDNVYGGCRKADVKPLSGGSLVDHVSSPDGYQFPSDLAARLLVRGGDINNVYGGNDVSGKVYFGNAIGIYTSIRGDVFGGGNGSYPYTDNEKLKNDETYSDLYYNPDEVLANAGITTNATEGLKSAMALNAFRPNSEQVSLRVVGKKVLIKNGTPGNSADSLIVNTIIGGSIYVGGNSATLKKKEGVTSYLAELKIGSYVIADSVFLGNNGKNMVTTAKETDALRLFPRMVEKDGTLVTEGGNASDTAKPFNSMDLTDSEQFKEYMKGCAMDLLPGVVFDSKKKGDPADYDAYTSYFGSFYCGGNVGSMTKEGLDTINFNHKVIIYDKLVGGCNNAIVPKTNYNAEYIGGILGAPETDTSNKLVLNLSGLKIEPKRWAIDRNADYTPKLTNGQPTYLLTTGEYPQRYLEWNTVDSREYDPDTKTFKEMAPATDPNDIGNSGDDDLARRLYGGNIYGGCYSSGIVNGNVVINLNATIVEREKLFDVVQSDELGEEESLYGSDQTTETTYNITKRNTGVILGQQGMDVLGSALNVFGGGKGRDTEIWGSTVINLNRGYTFQIFGGSEEGVIGKHIDVDNQIGQHATTSNNDYVYDSSTGEYSFNGKVYKNNPNYSCYVNLCGTKAGVSKATDQSEDMAECEFMYGGGFFGPICGNTVINMGNGRIFNSFAGSCNGDILGTAETFIGRQVKIAYKSAPPVNVIGTDVFEPGFPWIRDIVYGANDLGGRILGENNYKNRVRGVRSSDTSYSFDVINMVHNPGNKVDPDVLKASAYVEYLQGRADAIFGGCYGTYDYKADKFDVYTDDNGEPLRFDTDTDGDGKKDPKFFKPRLNNAFVNFRPTYYNQNNVVNKVYGAGQGQPGETDRDLMQNRSYVLIDIPQISSDQAVNFNKYSQMEVFGAGAWGGVGMNYTYEQTTADGFDLDKASAIIDLVRGEISAVYGGSYEEGVTRRTVVNVPEQSTINIKNIFGGAYGTQILPPCDVYESHVNYHNTSEKARLTGAIYGGNNSERRTIYTQLNISSPVWSDKTNGYLAKVYGAGKGLDTWSEYTEVNLLDGAKVYEVYGGGEMGHVLNSQSVQQYMSMYKSKPSDQISTDDPTWKDNKYWNLDNGKKTTLKTGKLDETDEKTIPEMWAEDWKKAWTIGNDYYTPNEDFNNYASNTKTNLSRVSDRPELGEKTAALLHDKKKFNTNVIINEGATVVNYAYAGGYGDTGTPLSGDVYGTTYVTLLGGTVDKDIYAAGTAGSVTDLFGVGNGKNGFTASANAYIKGGTVRNVYGGGWRGSVGYHKGVISDVANNTNDIDGHAHVIIGDADGASHVSGIPSVTRNVYGGGEGGAIYGDAHVIVNNGYIGYRFNGALNDDTATELDERYVAELDDAVPGDNLLEKGGNVFGGGYVANSYVDRSHIEMWDGIVRGGLYGGGEIGPIGRGTVHSDTLRLAKVSEYIMHNHTGSAQPAAIYKGGSTEVNLYGGHIMRDVFGGGRGYDNWGGEGWMTEDEKLTMDRSSKGYVFGQTNVHIHGGEIGTTEGVLQGYGNVFGGGNEGFVYSDKGKKVGSDRNDEHLTYGVPTDGGGFYYKDGDEDLPLTRDCYVEVAPECKVKPGCSVVIGTTTYNAGDYVPTSVMNQLGNWNLDKAKWENLDTRGVIIHNALFAGGNITEGSDKLFANTVTVYGNAGASLRDVFNIDLITLGTDDMGGLYGDGNLTLVDGFRELHIDNYGTDYYSLNETMKIEDYELLTERQQAYYQLKYVTATDHTYDYYECKTLHTTDNGVTYKKGQKVTAETYATFTEEEKKKWAEGRKTYQEDDQIEESEYILMDEAEKAAWTLFGVTSIYAGRPMNTIQRADMCGVFGSRMVMQGAQDRVPEAVDYTNYTINRVDEVSLNKSTQSGTDHGNYFGIYNVVNYLGNLTSDVFFDDVRKTDSKITANQADGVTTYYQWKEAKPQAKNRNNGISHNMVALASGVYLEIKREEGELTGTDDWGYITGVIELDLINVMQGMGGGYVYARNEHGKKVHHDDYGKVTMLDENISARTYRRFTYTNSNDGRSKEFIQTSGNFVHNTKQIVDDCYPNSGMYNPTKAAYEDSPAHYWFIRGQIYVYEQYISAYTGSANAYAEKVEMPLTIAAASNGRMTLREVQPNYYAYYDKNGVKLGTDGGDERLIISNKTYYLNDPVSYWDYRLMSEADRARFEKDTYVVIEDCSVDGTPYAKGAVLTMDEYDSMKSENNGSGPAVTYTEGDQVKTDGNFFYFFRSSNNISHDNGYLLTYEVNNPNVWNKYYTKTASPTQADKLSAELYNKGQDKEGNTITTSDYTAGPTFTPKSGSSVYGQEEIKIGDIINGTTVTKYTSTVSGNLTDANRYAAVAEGTMLTEGATYYTSAAGAGEFKATGNEVADGTNYFIGQATVTEPTYVVTREYSVKDKNGVETQHLNPGTPIYQSKYNDTSIYRSDLWATMTGGSDPAVVPAKVCKKMLEFSTTDYVYVGQLLTAADITAMKAKVKAKNTDMTDAQAEAYLNEYIDDAYYCTKNGLYGGTYFETGKVYRAIDTWCTVSAADRANFIYNYDALDLLVDPTFSGRPDDLETNYGFKPQYDGYKPESTQDAVNAGTATAQHAGSTPLNPIIYSKTQPIDYQAECTMAISYTDESNQTVNWSKNSAQSSWLTREQYEDIPNEKRHYSPISVTEPGDYYMVKTAFMHGDVPYTVGQQVDSKAYESMTRQQKAYLDVVNFPASLCSEPRTETVDGKQVTVYDEKYYYYCREPYTINEKGEGKPVKAVVANANGRKSDGTTEAISADAEKTSGEVPAGFVIAQGTDENDANTYKSLTNLQTGNFLIHGTSPTEISTFYVSNESDINDLSKEKIITVIYLYEYEESDESGLNVVPVSERHIVNIHINFKSGVPEIGEIDPPTIVLPGTTLGLNTPTVTQGAYRVTESGWEIFADGADATTHYNGQPYTNGETPVWWYENGYYIAYYAKTRLGKTYSNSVPVSVANYHDMKKVWDDKEHHYYIDHKDVDYEPKIYINDYTTNDPATSESGLDMFKNLIDLSHKTLTYNGETGVPVPYENTEDATDPLNGHVPLDNTHVYKPMRGGQYLKFFMRADQDHSGRWTPIANNNDECFSGVLHGDGYTISGLTNSLFNHLCGNVYNLGVTGSFTGAGVAETGDGYVENCWINTTGTPNGSVYAVFGNPTDDVTTTKQIVNSYYQATKNYKTDASEHGLAKPMPDNAFYNGTVAYNLNGFYLWKRFCDKTVSTGEDIQKYQYFTVGNDNSLTLQPAKYYEADASLCSSGYNNQKYVEDRFADGDFIYAGGTIPETPNERLHTYVENEKPKTAYYPIWPDDYIFFGQALNYGHMDGKNGRDDRTHQPLPSVINKADNRVLTTKVGNRVYRAPAYFRSYNMGVAHFNPWAVFAAYEKLTDEQIAANVTAREAYKDMTAIDFTGYNDASYPYQKGWNQWSKTSQLAQSSEQSAEAYAFFPPLLDDGGLQDMYADVTRNLLAYTMTSTDAAAQTDRVVANYLQDEAYTETETAPVRDPYFNTYRYHTVDERDAESDIIRGHRVQKQSNGSFMALNDHVLIDRQDFNAPMMYTFAPDHRMWYQRKPDNYVDIEWSNDPTPVRSTKGWEGISLPFKAEIVTTNYKGELTHFYNNSDDPGKNDVGHEYWLRNFTTGGSVETVEGKRVYVANMVYPTSNSDDGQKDYTNTFLWDYYYSHNNLKHADNNTTGEDQNNDEYQEDDDNRDYYKFARTYSNYPRMAGATPYIIGFPGARYYEFDLSGRFVAETAKSISPEKLEAQTITFASKPGATTIGVSDEETGVDVAGYTFKPSYLNETLESVKESEVSTKAKYYALNAVGNAYIAVTRANDAAEGTGNVSVAAFRPYFTSVAGTNPSRQTRSIVFSQLQEEEKYLEPRLPGYISARSGRHKIITTSTMEETVTVRIVSPSGLCIATFDLQPGESRETHIVNGGVYIVQSADGRFTKKLMVK